MILIGLHSSQSNKANSTVNSVTIVKRVSFCFDLNQFEYSSTEKGNAFGAIGERLARRWIDDISLLSFYVHSNLNRIRLVILLMNTVTIALD